MIRNRTIPGRLLDAWLVLQHEGGAAPAYRLRAWREDRGAYEAVRAEVEQYFSEAFDDARRRLRKGFSDSLSPVAGAPIDPAANYPSALHRITLQGYLGEVLAALAVEHWGAHGHRDWKVPAFLFRFHDQEFQHLDSINDRLRRGENVNRDAVAEMRPGRTGDDALAFRMDAAGRITDILALEAKCVGANRREIIQQAHEKVSAAAHLVSGIFELVSLLEDYPTPQAQVWQKALIEVWRASAVGTRRSDGVTYACGAIPQRNPTWLPAVRHASYVANRNLECFEFQVEDLDGMIHAIFRA